MFFADSGVKGTLFSDVISSLIEPIMIVFMGLMIGGLMIAMYSPIFNVGALIN